jgi:hypothetical protein
LDHFTVAVNTQGERRTIVVHVYPTQEGLVRSVEDFNGDILTADTQAVVNAWARKTNPQAILRLCHERLLDHVIVHEVVHAAQAIYRWTADMETPAAEHFTHYNEDFAHLVSDLYMGVWDGLRARYTITTA